MENFFGTNPVITSAGVISGEKVGNTFTFAHPRNATPAEDISVVYQWSKDLTTFNDSGTTDLDGTTAALAYRVSTGASVPMLSGGTLAKGDDRQIHVVPLTVGAGSYAWWVSGENQKARPPQPYRPMDENSAAQIRENPYLQYFLGLRE